MTIRVFAFVSLASWLLASTAAADEAAANPQSVVITSCQVYAARSANPMRDCTKAASAICSGKSRCELPIGSSLSGGVDIDKGNPKKVRVTYECGGNERVNGPHDQSEFATMVLVCEGGGF